MQETRVPYPGEGNGYPVQYSCLENLMHRRDLAVVHEVTKSQTWLSDFLGLSSMCWGPRSSGAGHSVQGLVVALVFRARGWRLFHSGYWDPHWQLCDPWWAFQGGQQWLQGFWGPQWCLQVQWLQARAGVVVAAIGGVFRHSCGGQQQTLRQWLGRLQTDTWWWGPWQAAGPGPTAGALAALGGLAGTQYSVYWVLPWGHSNWRWGHAGRQLGGSAAGQCRGAGPIQAHRQLWGP